MDAMDELDEPEPVRAEPMPKKVLIAVVALWVSAVGMALATFALWTALYAEGELGDALYQYPVQAGSSSFLILFAVLAAVGVQRHTNQGRIAGIVVGCAGILIALNNQALGIEWLVALVAFIVMLPMLFSADAKAWCPKPTRRSGTPT